MKILCLDTAMAACSAAVLDTESQSPLAEDFTAMERGHAEALAPMVARVMRASGIGYGALDRIAVTVGPGSFTGVRIGLSFARGLGLALGIPVTGIDTLSAIAANDTAATPLMVAADARNGEVYAASFGPDRRLTSLPRILPVSETMLGAAAGTRVIGTAASEAIAASGRSDLTASPDGDLPVAARFGAMAAAMAAGSSPAPLYLRAPDAKPQTAGLRKFGELTIQDATPSSAPLMAALHGEAFAEGWGAEAFAGLLATPGTSATIALTDEEPVGFLLTRAAADEAEIITIGTRPSVQRRGVARQLLEQQMSRLAAVGVCRLFLEVASSNIAAQSLYAALGFSEAGRRKGYYKRAGAAEDAIVMRRELHP